MRASFGPRLCPASIVVNNAGATTEPCGAGEHSSSSRTFEMPAQKCRTPRERERERDERERCGISRTNQMRDCRLGGGHGITSVPYNGLCCQIRCGWLVQHHGERESDRRPTSVHTENDYVASSVGIGRAKSGLTERHRLGARDEPRVTHRERGTHIRGEEPQPPSWPRGAIATRTIGLGVH